MRPPALTLILCSRNDEYMGNSRWRLETTLDYIGARLLELTRQKDVEVLVADWGSDVPLKDVVRLTPAAAAIVSFLTIPAAIARRAQGESPFAEVIALNAAARRGRGEYIGRIDQDTLVGSRFFETFFDLHEGRREPSVPLPHALLYSNRREIPYRFAARCPPAADVRRFVSIFGSTLPVLRISASPFWTYYVGVWLAHRALWEECRGYDERLVFYNWMEVDMILRLSTRYPLVDLGALVSYDFYHLDHVHPRHRQVRHGRKNPDMDWDAPPAVLRPNDDSWGLGTETLSIDRVDAAATDAWAATTLSAAAFPARVAMARLHGAWDDVSIYGGQEIRRALGRTRKAWVSVRREPIRRWPRVLGALWSSRSAPGAARQGR